MIDKGIEATHTPGPWEFWDSEEYEHRMITDESGAVGIAKMITRMRGMELFPEEMRANARLIVASPTLLKALKDLRAQVAAMGLVGLAIRNADLAIAKAEGKVPCVECKQSLGRRGEPDDF